MTMLIVFLILSIQNFAHSGSSSSPSSENGYTEKAMFSNWGSDSYQRKSVGGYENTIIGKKPLNIENVKSFDDADCLHREQVECHRCGDIFENTNWKMRGLPLPHEHQATSYEKQRDPFWTGNGFDNSWQARLKHEASSIEVCPRCGAAFDSSLCSQ